MSNLKKRLSFLIFNFGNKRLRNLWYTMTVVADIRKKNPELDDIINFVLVESAETMVSELQAERTGFDYRYYDDDPLCTSHRSTLRNVAVNEAETEWVIVHDNDIIPDPKFFEDVLDAINKTKLEYFSNFKDVINLSEDLSSILIADIKGENKFDYGYVNGTDPTQTKNFQFCQSRPHGFFTFNEATGGSFTIKKEVYQSVKFDESYNDWGAEDNFFKLSAVQKIGWEKFGMLNKTLLHSYHQTADVSGYDGKTIIINSALCQNRNRFYSSLDKISPTLNTEDFIMKDLNNVFIAIKRDKGES